MPAKKRTASGVLGGFLGLIGLSAVAGLLVTATVTPAIAITSNAANSAIGVFDNLPSYLDIDDVMVPTTIYYKNPDTGEWVEDAQFFDQIRVPVTSDEIAPVVFDAVLSSEDPRYYEHGGIDLIGTARALLQNAQGGDTQGGSSISQQYVKNVLVQKCELNAEATYKKDENGETVLNEDGSPVVEVTEDEAKQSCWLKATTASGVEGYGRKIQEMRYAIALEQRYSKNQILLEYLNIANMGGIIYGIEAAAEYYFGVTANQLSLAQAATLAGMVQNPNSFRIDKKEGSFVHGDGSVTNSEADGYADAKTRRNYVLDRMLTDGKITQEQHDAAKAEPVTPNVTQPQQGCVKSIAPYFCQYVKSTILSDPAFGATRDDRQKKLRQGGMQVYTTLDPRLQQVADQTMAEYTVPYMTLRGDPASKFGSAATSVEVDTGRILAIAQNTKFTEDKALSDADPSYSALVYAADNAHGSANGFSTGSTFKLFTLIDWLEKGLSLNEVLNGRVRLIKHFTNSCQGDWVPTSAADRKPVPNSEGAGGYVGTPLRFTAQSINSGFLAMAEKLDLCDVKNVATRLGVRNGNDGSEVNLTTPFSVVGSSNIAPLAMAAAYGTVANNGVYCTPRAIDRVTDAQGNDLPLPESSCTQQIAPNIAATAAYALRGVMTGGTGVAGNPGGAVPVIGKTGTHNKQQKWLIESSTKVATAVWAGNERGDGNITASYTQKGAVVNLPFGMNRQIQRTANDLYGGGQFPGPDQALLKSVYTDLPNVVGMTIDQATQTLQDAGFDVSVGPEVDSSEGAGLVGAQNPGAGKVAGGTTVTINPSNGQGVAVPDVSGRELGDAINTVRSRGFGDVRPGSCSEDGSMPPGQRTATGTSPGGVANRNTTISVDYKARNCP